MLDPLGDGNDRLDPAEQPGYVPAGFSTSNEPRRAELRAGLGPERSATFAGGSATVTADEVTHRGDILVFAGLDGIEHARVVFGLRDSLAGRGFLLRITRLAGCGPGAGTGLHAADRHRPRRPCRRPPPPSSRQRRLPSS